MENVIHNYDQLFISILHGSQLDISTLYGPLFDKNKSGVG